MSGRRRTAGELAAGEPAVVRGVVTAAVGLLVSLGVVSATDVDVDAVVVLVLALAPIVSSLWTRFAVTPVDRAARTK